jgi:HAD superfamily phosphatase (TIGR01668 family)
MGVRLAPDAAVSRVTDIAPQVLRARGVDAVVVDLDNTLTRWNEPSCAPEVAAWLAGLRAAGIGVCILSNNGPERVRAFCAGLGEGSAVPWVAHAGKPRPSAYRRALRRIGAEPGRALVVGDQLFTDVLGAKLAGLRAVLVRPLSRSEFPLTRLLRLVEAAWLRRLEAGGFLRSL